MFKKILLVVACLGLVACSRGPKTTLEDIKLGLEVDSKTNEVISEVEDLVPSSTETVYLAGKVNNGIPGTEIAVEWRRDGVMLSTQKFFGQKDSERPFDFLIGSPVDNHFYASISRQGVAWPDSEYTATVFLNGKQVTTKKFRTVSDVTFSNEQLKSLIVSAALSTEAVLATQEVKGSQTSFDRLADHIYFGMKLKPRSDSLSVATEWEYVSSHQQITKLTKTLSPQDSNLLFDLARSRFGSLWPDGKWPVGLYRVRILINAVEVKIIEFKVA